MRVGGGVHGVQNPLFPHAKVIFLYKVEEIRWNDLHFYIADTWSNGVGIISNWGRRGGGGG